MLESFLRKRRTGEKETLTLPSLRLELEEEKRHSPFLLSLFLREEETSKLVMSLFLSVSVSC